MTHNLEGPMRLWSVETGDQVGVDLSAHSGFVLDTAFTPDGSSMISVGSDGKVGLWDTSTWHLFGLSSASFRDRPAAGGWRWLLDWERIFSVFEDGSTREWSVDPDRWEAWACRVAGRSLIPREWEEFMSDRPCDLLATRVPRLFARMTAIDTERGRAMWPPFPLR